MDNGSKFEPHLGTGAEVDNGGIELTTVATYAHEGWQITIYSVIGSDRGPFRVRLAAMYGGKEHTPSKEFSRLEAAKQYANSYAAKHQKW